MSMQLCVTQRVWAHDSVHMDRQDASGHKRSSSFSFSSASSLGFPCYPNLLGRRSPSISNSRKTFYIFLSFPPTPPSPSPSLLLPSLPSLLFSPSSFSLFTFFFVCFCRQGFLCSRGCLGTHSVARIALHLEVPALPPKCWD